MYVVMLTYYASCPGYLIKEQYHQTSARQDNKKGYAMRTLSIL